MRIRWTPAAAADLQQISDYLREHYPHYRQATLRKLFDTIRNLRDAPHLGKPGRVEGTREILFPPMWRFTALENRASKFSASGTRRRIAGEFRNRSTAAPDKLLWTTLEEGCRRAVQPP